MSEYPDENFVPKVKKNIPSKPKININIEDERPLDRENS